MNDARLAQLLTDMTGFVEAGVANEVWREILEGLRELRAWRMMGGPILEKLVGGCRGGEVARDMPSMDEDDLVELGALMKVEFDPKKHPDPEELLEEGDDHYVLTPVAEVLLGSRR